MTTIRATDRGEWSTDLESAPLGKDLLLLQWNLRGAATILRLGMRVFQPDDHGRDTYEGERGSWRWMVDGEDDYLDDAYVAAWRLPPALPVLTAPMAFREAAA